MMGRLEWSKLTIDLAEVDVPLALGSWHWLLGKTAVKPLVLTRFGDWFLADSRRVVHRLDVLEGVFEPICKTLEEFEKRRTGDDELLDWFQDGMVYAVYESGKQPQRGQGFGYVVPPIIGGSVERHNVRVVEATSWQMFMANLHEKMRFVPQGARIKELRMSPKGELEIVHD